MPGAQKTGRKRQAAGASKAWAGGTPTQKRDFPLAHYRSVPMVKIIMNPDIQKAVDAGKLTPAAGAALDLLQPGTYVTHKSWGFGQVDSINYLISQMTIHFKGKRDHSMQLQ